jgi:hypothetical protein
VDDIGDVGVLGKDVIQLLFHSYVGIVQLWPNPSQQFNPIDGFAGRVGEIVNNDNFVSRLNQGQNCKGANVARAATGCEK